MVSDGVLVVVAWSGRVRAFDEVSGQLLWARDLGHPGCVSTPACALGRLVVARGDGQVVCMALETGQVRWQRATEGGPHAPVAIQDDLVVVSQGFPSASLEALDLATGTERWSITLPEVGYAGPAVTGGAIVVGTNDGAYRAHSAADGRVLWTCVTLVACSCRVQCSRAMQP